MNGSCSGSLLCLLLLGALASGCGSEADAATTSGALCETTSSLTYTTFGQAFMTQYCTRCHSASVTGTARAGAPVGMNFDTLAGVQSSLSEIDAEAASGATRTNTDMPPSSPAPTLSERTKLGEWLACGAP